MTKLLVGSGNVLYGHKSRKRDSEKQIGETENENEREKGYVSRGKKRTKTMFVTKKRTK